MTGSSPDGLGIWVRALMTRTNEQMSRAKGYGERTSGQVPLALQHSSPRGSGGGSIGPALPTSTSKDDDEFAAIEGDCGFDEVAEVGQDGVTDTEITGPRHEKVPWLAFLYLAVENLKCGLSKKAMRLSRPSRPKGSACSNNGEQSRSLRYQKLAACVLAVNATSCIYSGSAHPRSGLFLTPGAGPLREARGTVRQLAYQKGTPKDTHQHTPSAPRAQADCQGVWPVEWDAPCRQGDIPGRRARCMQWSPSQAECQEHGRVVPPKATMTDAGHDRCASGS
ncbi:hypothetical protein ACCO45_011985 [Purpureocillium lilacinum]|uniref:Uncharacterized protein n=1 Tax=Purpureocillium lilacinum TaxID=33203 RepID=A0ACC4DEN5_PURLI